MPKVTRCGYDSGATFEGPLLTKFRRDGDTQARIDEVLGCNPRSRVDKDEDFDRGLNTFEVTFPLIEEDGQLPKIDDETGDVARGSYMVPRAGYLVSVRITAETLLATDNTNYLTFLLTNNGQSGAGTTAMLDATGDANTTKTAGGAAIAAEIGRNIAVSATAANLRVAAGDLLTFTATVSGTLANEVLTPAVRLVFATAPDGTVPRTTKTVGLLACQPVASSANGEMLFQLGSTSEANVTGLDRGDQLTIPANTRAATTASGAGPLFQCWLKWTNHSPNTGPASGVRGVWGLASAYNATFDTVSHNAWFRIDAANSTTVLDLRVETDDDTTNRDDQATGITLTADTYYLFTVDARDPAAVNFWVNDTLCATLSAAAWVNTHLLQPVVWLQKDSGTTTETITLDWWRVTCNRK